MVTANQISRGCRGKRKWRSRTPAFKGSPQRRGVCMRVYTTKPKKPNSAVRKVAKVFLPGSNRRVLAYIPGQGHNLSTHSVVFVRGGRVRDVPGMHYKLVRNVYDFVGSESILRTNRRSKYGLKR